MRPEALTDDVIASELYGANEAKDRGYARLCRNALVPDGQRVVAVWWHAREQVAMRITERQAASLTDAEILAFGRTRRDGTAHDAVARNMTVIALGLAGPGHGEDSIRAARRLIVESLDAGKVVL